MSTASKDLYKNTRKADEYLISLQKKFAENNDITRLFNSPKVLNEVYKGCMEKSTITVKVDRVHFPDYPYPQKLVNGVLADRVTGDTYEVPEKEIRCNDDYHPDHHIPYELILPEDYAVHFTRGIANTLRLLFQYSYGMSETPGYNNTKGVAPTGPVSEYSYFNIFEATEREAIESIKYFKDILKDELLAQYQASRTAFNATYIVTIIYVIGIFGYLFESTRKDLAKELQHNRGIIFMIPSTVISKSKPIIEYVERVLHELLG
jgi:hypothetical protein